MRADILLFIATMASYNLKFQRPETSSVAIRRSYCADVVLPAGTLEGYYPTTGTLVSLSQPVGMKEQLEVTLKCIEERRRPRGASHQEYRRVTLQETAELRADLQVVPKANRTCQLILHLGDRRGGKDSSAFIFGSVACHHVSQNNFGGKCFQVFAADLKEERGDCSKFTGLAPPNHTTVVCPKQSPCPTKRESVQKMLLAKGQAHALKIKIEFETFGTFKEVKHDAGDNEAASLDETMPASMQRQFFSSVAEMYKDGSCTDVILICKGEEFPFYKLVLASYSEVFKVTQKSFLLVH